MASANKGAAGARRSAIAERARLQAEWAALKNSDANEILRGVVALVDVGEGSKAVALRAALMALGATVVLNWSPLVTHVVWSAEGSRQIRADARSLAARVVSPLWVEACASASRRLPEQAFPSATRPSDLPSPRALRRMLRLAEKENISLSTIYPNFNQKEKQEKPKLRISSDTSLDKSTDKSNQSTDKSDQSSDKSNDSIKTAIPSKVNTAPRRAPLMDVTKKKSKRKLFTYKEGETVGSSSEEDESKLKSTMKSSSKMTQRERRDLLHAERMARKLANVEPPRVPVTQYSTVLRPKIVLTGMSKSEYKMATEAIKQLNGIYKRNVNKKTTHVVLGSCKEDKENTDFEITGIQPMTEKSVKFKARTLHSLEGAARGCKILNCDWLRDCKAAGYWLQPFGYEVPHLVKISQRARVERSALGKLKQEYAYNVFNKMKVCLGDTAEQKHAAITLLKLCGADIVSDAESANVVIGKENKTVSSKWVFDSVAAGRPRSLKKYLNDETQCGIDADVFMSDSFW